MRFRILYFRENMIKFCKFYFVRIDMYLVISKYFEVYRIYVFINNCYDVFVFFFRFVLVIVKVY